VATNAARFLSAMEELVVQAQKVGIDKAQDLLQAAKSGRLYNPVSFGGNTTCTEVGHKGQSVYIDMGSGLREAGTAAVQQGLKELHILVTHMHWDHVMGLPFFIPIHIPGHKIHIYHVHKNAPEYIRINFNGINFPLSWEQLNGTVEFHQHKPYDSFKIGEMTITPFVLDHPGGSFGYHIAADGKKMAIGVDSEYKRLTPKELGRDLKYFQNLDLLLFDAQYEMAELASKFDWGHCSPTIGVDLALREGIKNLLFTHHDPWATDEKLRRMFANSVRYMHAHLADYREHWDLVQPGGPKLQMAYDGLTVEL
jgi:phosphoribosyl 1,2-cyclic phosphodiesterase